MRTIRRLLALALFAGLFYVAWRFTHSNEGTIRIDWLLGETPPLPVWLALLAAFGLGALSAGAALLYELVKKSLVARRYRKAVHGLESEIHQLRNLPLAGEETGAAARRSTPVDRSS